MTKTLEQETDIGVPLISRTVPFVRFARASDVDLEAYEDSISRLNEMAQKSLRIFSTGKNGVLQRSNCFAPAYLFHTQKIPLATSGEFAQAFNANPDYFLGTYSDPGIVLRTAGDSYKPNDAVAKDLAKKIKHRGIKVGEVPLFIPQRSLVPVEGDSEYGLLYDLTEEPKIIPAPEFSHGARTKRFNKFNEQTGNPVPEQNGSYGIYTRQDGLSGFDVYACGDADSDRDDLDYSSELGRVVLRDEVARENLEGRVREEVNRAYKKAVSDLAQRKERAIQAGLSELNRK